MTGNSANQNLDETLISRIESPKAVKTGKKLNGRQLTETGKAFKKLLPILRTIESSDNEMPDINSSSTEITSVENGRSVCLSLRCRDLDVTLNVKSSDNQDILELTAEIALLRTRLQEYAGELRNAHQEIGFLKAQILMQNEQLSLVSKSVPASNNDFV